MVAFIPFFEFHDIPEYAVVFVAGSYYGKMVLTRIRKLIEDSEN